MRRTPTDKKGQCVSCPLRPAMPLTSLPPTRKPAIRALLLDAGSNFDDDNQKRPAADEKGDVETDEDDVGTTNANRLLRLHAHMLTNFKKLMKQFSNLYVDHKHPGFVCNPTKETSPPVSASYFDSQSYANSELYRPGHLTGPISLDDTSCTSPLDSEPRRRKPV